MKAYKENYLKQIRTDTAYPTYRGIIGVIVFLGYLLVTINFIAFLGGGFNEMKNSFGLGVFIIFFGIIVSVLGIVVVRYVREVALMIADMVDSIIDANSRDSQNLG